MMSESSFVEPFDLSKVVMPLVRVMARGRLSWAQREEISNAIQECYRAYDSLMEEHYRATNTAQQSRK